MNKLPFDRRPPLALLVAAGLALPVWAGPVPGAVESWNDGMAAWLDRDPGEMIVTHAAFGNPAGSLAGEFFPSISPDVDAFRAVSASSGGSFTGNYRLQFAVAGGFGFDFYAADTLPSSVIVRFGNTGTVFFQSVTAQIPGTGAWHRAFVSLASAAGWSGPAAEFSNMLANVEFVEVQVTRSGQSSERYYLDNFGLELLRPFALRYDGLAPGYIDWSDLKAGAGYEVQASPKVTGTWVAVDSFTATNPDAHWLVPATNVPIQLYRLSLTSPAM